MISEGLEIEEDFEVGQCCSVENNFYRHLCVATVADYYILTGVVLDRDATGILEIRNSEKILGIRYYPRKPQNL